MQQKAPRSSTLRKTQVRVLIYSQDGFGLGHLRRNLNVTLRIKGLCPQASVLIIADSPVAPFFNLPPQCDFIKIPTIVKMNMGVWRSNGLSVTQKELITIRSQMIADVVETFRPHVFLVDHMPNGAQSELGASLKMLKQSQPQAKVILGLRDILGAAEDICPQWHKDGAYTAADQYYDEICVYGCPNLFDLASVYRFPKNLQDKTTSTGYVCRRNQPQELEEEILRKWFPDFEGRLIVVTGGGGHDAMDLMKTFLGAAKVLFGQIPFHAIIATGPFMDPSQLKLLTKRAEGLPVLVTPTGPDAIRLLQRADLVISMAGYNTVSEILYLRKKAIIVPRPGPSAEQTMRSELMSERGLFKTIHPRSLNAEHLASLISKEFHNGAAINEEGLPDLNGASNMASRVLADE